MFKRKPNPRVVELDTEISRVLAQMANMLPEDEEYTKASDNWKKLTEERDKLLSNRFSKDQVLLVGGNVLVALAVIGYERSHVITTNIHKFMSKSSR